MWVIIEFSNSRQEYVRVHGPFSKLALAEVKCKQFILKSSIPTVKYEIRKCECECEHGNGANPNPSQDI
jgi:hypothetical protein